MDGHVAMEEWKDPNPGPESLMSGVLTRAFPPDTISGHGNNISLHQEQGRSLPMTPQFGRSSGASSRSLAERMQARAGFSVPELSMPFTTADGAAASPYLTIPPGLSPATLLDSPPVFLSNAMGQDSPTTGKLLKHGDTNDKDPVRFEGPLGDGPGAFSFKPLDLKSSHYGQGKGQLCNNQNPSVASTQVSVKTEAKIQTVQEANLLGQLNQPGQSTVKSSSDDSKSKPTRLAPDAGAGYEHLSPPEEEGDARGDYPAMATAAAPAEDGYSWRKYGQKQVKHSEYPRSYYKCTHPSCPVKKKVERSHEGHVTEIIYKGTHNHPKPAQSRRPGVPPVHPFGDGQTDAADNPGSRPSATEARPAWQSSAGVHDLRGDGRLDATSSPSVPGEHCESSASMQVHEGARFGSPEGVDVTSAVSDEVDGGDRLTHGSMSHGGADPEGDELESKRRKLESYAFDMSSASRAVREPRVVIQTTSEVDILDDGYRWRKYGQKVVKGNPNPRSYYKCTHPGCSVRKHVERASHDLKSVITTYEGKHNHEVPAARNSGQPAAGQAHAVARRPEHPSAQEEGLMRLGGCAFGLPPRNPLAPMGNYSYSALGAPPLPSLPMPAGLGPVEGLKLPTLAPPPPLYPVLRHRQAMDAAGFVMPKVEAKGEAQVGSGNAAAGAGAAASGYQLLMPSGPLGHRM